MRVLDLLTTAACLVPTAITHTIPRDDSGSAIFPAGWDYCKHFPKKGSITLTSFEPRSDLRQIKLGEDGDIVRELKFHITGTSTDELKMGTTIEGEAKKVGKEKQQLCGGESKQKCPSKELDFEYFAQFAKGKKTKKSQRKVTVKIQNEKGKVLTCVKGNMNLSEDGKGDGGEEKKKDKDDKDVKLDNDDEAEEEEEE